MAQSALQFLTRMSRAVNLWQRDAARVDIDSPELRTDAGGGAECVTIESWRDDAVTRSDD
jgi:hypothetical protein